MFRYRLHRAMRRCMRCNRANDDEPSLLSRATFTRYLDWRERAAPRPEGDCSGSSLGLGLVPRNALFVIYSWVVGKPYLGITSRLPVIQTRSYRIGRTSSPSPVAATRGG